MNRKPVFLWMAILLGMLQGVILASDRAEIYFDPVRVSPNPTSLPLSLEITELSGVPIVEVRVLYRLEDENRFHMRSMKNEGFTYTTVLEFKSPSAQWVEYYFDIIYADASHNFYPEGAPTAHLFQTALPQVANYSNAIVVISPEQDEQIFARDIVITASFTRIADKVDVEKTKLYLDTWDLSRYVKKYEDFITLAPRQVPSGRHTIRLELYDRNARLIASREWSFTALQSFQISRETQGFRFHGRMFSEFRREGLQDNEFITDYNQGGLTFDGQNGPLEFGGRMYLSNQEHSDRQPVNRFSGYGKLNFWNGRFLFVRAGDAFPRFHPYILRNIFLRGVQGSLFLKFLNIDVAYGDTRRAVEGREYTYTNPLTQESSTQIIGGTYRRKILAVRTSFGDRKTMDFGFTYLNARDDTTSIKLGSNPEENAVFGSDLFLSLDRNRLVLDGSISASLYNSNVTGGTIPFDTLASQGDVDESARKFYDFASKLITVNEYLVLQPNLAYHGRIRMRYFNNYLSFLYESVDESYRSLGQPYMLRDNRGFHLSDRINLMNRQVFLVLGWRNYHNNLKNTKLKTTTNQNLYINLSYFPRGNLPEIVIGYNNYSRSNELTAQDTTLAIRPEDSQTNSFNFHTAYPFQLFNQQNRVGIDLMTYNRTDRINPFAESNSNFFSINWMTRYHVPLQTNLEFRYQQTKTGEGTQYSSSLEMLTFGVGVQYTLRRVFAEDQLFLRLYTRFSDLTSQSLSFGSTTLKYKRNFLASRITYSLTNIGTLSFLGNWIMYRGDREYDDFIYSARLEINF